MTTTPAEPPEPQPGPPDPAPLDPSVELERLRRENEALKAAVAVRPRRAGGWWRIPLSALLIAFAVVLAPLSVLATWAADVVGDTDRYVETVAPLADDPAVQGAVSRRVTTTIFSYLDVEQVTQELSQGLQERDIAPRAAAALSALSGPIEQGVQGFVGDRVDEFVRSDAFATAWVQAQTIAHEQMVAALSGETGGTVEITDGAVSVNMAALISTIKASLIERGFAIAERIPEVDASFVIFQSADLERAQTAYRLLEQLGRWLPLLALALLAAGVMVARDRRRALVVGALAIAGSMVVLALALNIGRTAYLDALPSGVDPAAAAVVFDALVVFLRVALRTVLLVFLVIAVGAFLVGPSPVAQRLRGALTRGSTDLRERTGWRQNAFGAWVHRQRGVLRVVAAVVAALVVVFMDRPSAGDVTWVLVVLLVFLAIVELLSAGGGEVAARVALPTASTTGAAATDEPYGPPPPLPQQAAGTASDADPTLELSQPPGGGRIPRS